MIKANFKIKKVIEHKSDEQKELEAIIEKSGVGSHMIFRSENKDDELFLDDL